MQSKLNVRKIRQVLNFIQMGKNKSEIAYELEIDRKTLNTWIEKGYEIGQRLNNEYSKGNLQNPSQSEKLYFAFYSTVVTAEFLRVVEYDQLYGDDPWPPMPKSLTSVLLDKEKEEDTE